MRTIAPFLPDDHNNHQEALVINYSAPAPACTVCTTRLAAYQDIIKRPSTIIKTPFLKTYLNSNKDNFFIALIRSILVNPIYTYILYYVNNNFIIIIFL